jgi:hypothetical protein
MNDSTLLAIALVGTTAALASALYGIAALWAASGRTSWLWRLTPIALLLAALAPIGAYELVALYGAQTVVVIVVISLARFVRRWRAVGNTRDAGVGALGQPLQETRGPRIQFLLTDLLNAALLIGAVLAIVREAAPGTPSTLGGRIVWTPLVATGAGFGVTTLAATWVVCGHWRWYFRVTVCALVLGGFGGVLESKGDPIGLFALAGNIELTSGGYSLLTRGGHLLLATVHGVAIMTCLLLAYRAGWAGRRRENPSDHQHAPLTESRIPERDAWRWPARVAACGVGLWGGWVLGSTYLALLPPTAPALEPLPVPNGYDELVKAGNGLNWAAVPSQDFDEATFQACESFVQANVSSFALLRKGLARPCQVPFDFNDWFGSENLTDMQGFRSLCRALTISGKVAAATGKYDGSMRDYLDIVCLGQKSCHGGILTHALVASGIEGEGVQGIVGQLNGMDASALGELTNGLEKLSGVREPLGVILERDRLWQRLAYGWLGRLYQCLSYTFSGGDSVYRLLPDFRARRCPTAAVTCRGGHPPAHAH